MPVTLPLVTDFPPFTFVTPTFATLQASFQRSLSAGATPLHCGTVGLPEGSSGPRVWDGSDGVDSAGGFMADALALVTPGWTAMHVYVSIGAFGGQSWFCAPCSFVCSFSDLGAEVSLSGVGGVLCSDSTADANFAGCEADLGVFTAGHMPPSFTGEITMIANTISIGVGVSAAVSYDEVLPPIITPPPPPVPPPQAVPYSPPSPISSPCP